MPSTISWQAASEAFLRFHPSTDPAVITLKPSATEKPTIIVNTVPKNTVSPTVSVTTPPTVASDVLDTVDDIAKNNPPIDVAPVNSAKPTAISHSDTTSIAIKTVQANVTPPNLPHKDVIAGSVFPPISGRIILHKLANEEIALTQTHEGHWEAKIGDQWQLLSRAEDCFSSANDARMHLLRYANTHKKLGTRLSEHRCMAIVESEQHNEWRVWQIVRNEATLDELLSHALMDFSPQRIAEKVYMIAEKFIDAYQLFTNDELNLPIDIGYIALHQDKPMFTGYIPHSTIDRPTLSALEMLNQSFKQPINNALKQNSALTANTPHVLHPLDLYAKSKTEHKAMIDILRRLFIGEH